MSYKKKLNVIRPTLRHKKRYLEIKLLNTNKLNLDLLDTAGLHKIFYKNYQKAFGLFNQIEANITIMDFNKDNKTILIRINRFYLNEFISSLFFLKNELNLFKINKISSTIKNLDS